MAKIIIYFPDAGKYNYTPPYEILMQAKALDDLPVDVLCVDGRFDDIRKMLNAHHKETILFVVSTIIKYTSITISKQFADAQDILNHVKTHYTIPVVLTGQAAGFLEYVASGKHNYDYAIKGISEEALRVMVKKMIKKKNISQNGGNKTSPLPDDYALYNVWEKYGNFNFSGINIEHYVKNHTIDYIATIGCVNACSYCTVPVNYRRHWYHNSTSNIIQHIHVILQGFPMINNIHFRDDNFFVNKTFIFELLENFKKHNFSFTWSAQTSINILEQYSSDELQRLLQAGCHNISVGVESGDPYILQQYTKSKTDAYKNKDIIRRIIDSGITASVTSLISFPDNNRRDFKKTLKYLMKLKLKYPELSMYCTVLQPIPGTSVFNKIYKDKKASSALLTNNTWTTSKEKERLKKYELFYFVFDNPQFYRYLPHDPGKKLRFLNLIFSPLIKLRFRLGYTGLLWEFALTKRHIKNVKKRYGINEDEDFSKVGIRHLTSKFGYGYKNS
ncbi:MAG: B12-binding domain-containing radical SAM protein [Bacteroidales bacterium]